MDLKSPIELQIFYENENSITLKELGVDTENNKSNKELRGAVFFSIDNVTPFYFDDDESAYGCVSSGGHVYISNLPYGSLARLITELV